MSQRSRRTRASMNSRDRVRHPSRSAGFMLSVGVAKKRICRSFRKFIPPVASFVAEGTTRQKIQRSAATKRQLQRKDQKTKMSKQSGMAWRPTAGGGGKLNLTNLTKAGPYRGGPCEFGHRVPGPVPRPVPNSFTGWGGQQTDPAQGGVGTSSGPPQAGHLAIGNLRRRAL